jgi:DNA recombination protein RmuC
LLYRKNGAEDSLKSLLSKLLFEMHQAQQNNSKELSNQMFILEKSLMETLSKHHTTLIEKNHQAQLRNTAEVSRHINNNMKDIREQLNHSFKYHADSLSKHVETLNQEVRNNLKQINTEVHKQLHEGFNKTTTTFTDVVKRLTVIDEAQKRISELSTHVVDLKAVFSDKRSRGAFGEVQLSGLIKNIIPPQHYAFQYTLRNQKRADCILFLPDPTGNIVIDAKFPLESYQALTNATVESEMKRHRAQFRQDIKKHIHDIAGKYIIKDETAEGAIMFIPAEAIFAEIHANYPDLVSISHQEKVWLASPSTLMAILTTARAVLKDDATKKQVHLVQKHLNSLAKDFNRFEKRMQNLSRHINQANEDVGDVNTSAKKITQRFNKIEKLEIETPTNELAHEVEN